MLNCKSMGASRAPSQQLALQPREDHHCTHPRSEWDCLIWQLLWWKCVAGKEVFLSAYREHPRQEWRLAGWTYAGMYIINLHYVWLSLELTKSVANIFKHWCQWLNMFWVIYLEKLPNQCLRPMTVWPLFHDQVLLPGSSPFFFAWNLLRKEIFLNTTPPIVLILFQPN